MAQQAYTVRRIGLTGGIGSGKSAAAAVLRELGAHVVDTDAIAHQVTAAGGPAINAVRQRFGDPYIDRNGAMDRARMRELVFADPEARRALEAIVHPLIEQAALQAAAAAADAVVVFEVPLLVESGRWYRRVERVLVIDCDEAVQVERVTRRAGLSEAMVRSVMAQQATRAARRAAADAVIDNSRLSMPELRGAAEAVWRHWTAPARLSC